MGNDHPGGAGSSGRRARRSHTEGAEAESSSPVMQARAATDRTTTHAGAGAAAARRGSLPQPASEHHPIADLTSPHSQPSLDARQDAGGAEDDDEHSAERGKGGQRFSFTLPPPAAAATTQVHGSGLPPPKTGVHQQRRNQYLSLDFLPAASSPGAHSAPPSLLAGSPSPLMGTLTPSPLSAAMSSSAISSGVGSSSSSLSLPPPMGPGSWNSHKSHSAGHSALHSAGSSYSNSASSSSSSSPKISASLTQHHMHAARGMRNSAPAGSEALLPRSPPPTLSRPTSDPCFDGSSSAAIHAAAAATAAAAPTVETFAVHTHYNSSGQKQINQYVIEGGEIGRGSYGTVKLVFNTQDQQYYAMKVMNKSLLKKRRVMGFTAGLTASASRTASMGPGGLAALRAGAGAAASAGVSSTAAVPAAQANSRAFSSGAVSGSSGCGGGGGSSATEHWTNVQREIAIMKRLRHENVVRLYEVMDDPSTDNLYLIVEYMERGALMSGELDKLHALPLQSCWNYFRDVVLGLEYLHFNFIIHRDIKPENLLLGKNDRVKITDFGVSMLFEGDNDRILQNGTTVGSAAFLPPELCGGGLGIGGAAGAAGSGSRGIACVPSITPPPPSPLRVLSSPVLAPSRHLLAPPPSALSPPPLHPAAPAAANQNQPTAALMAVLGGLSADNRSFSMPVGLPPPSSAAAATAASSSSSSSGTVLPRSSPPHAHHTRSNSDSLGSPSEISGKKGDLWALGITLYVMVFGRLPFMAKTVHLIYKAIVEEDLQVPPLALAGGPGSKDCNPNNVTPETQPDLIDLLHRMLDKNPHTRISLLEIKAHPWVTKRGAEPMEEQCDYEGTAAAMQAAAVAEEEGSQGRNMLSNALQRRLDRAAKKQSQAHARAQSGSSSLGPALQEEDGEEEELTDTEDEREEGQDTMDQQGLPASRKDLGAIDDFGAPRGRSATYAPTSSGGAAAAVPARGHRPSMSYQHITLTREDMLGAVTLVSRVILVVKLKAKMKKARLNLASAVRARSASMGDVGNHPARVAALAAIQARAAASAAAAAAKSPERSKKPSPAAFECLSPSLSRDTHISVPLPTLEAAAPGPAHAKRRPIKPTSHLLAEARAAIVAGTAGQDAAQAWGAAHPRDGEDSSSSSPPAAHGPLFSPSSPASSPGWKGSQSGAGGGAGGRMGRLGLLRRKSSLTPKTPSLLRSHTEPPTTPGASASPPATAASGSHAGAGSCAEDALHGDVPSPASAPDVLSSSCAPRHQSAPLRPPPALFVPYDTYLQTQPASLSCSNASASEAEEQMQRSTRHHAVLVEKQKQREAEAEAAALAAAAHMEDEISRAAARKVEYDAAARRRNSDAHHTDGSDEDFDDEAIESIEPDQDLDI